MVMGKTLCFASCRTARTCRDNARLETLYRFDGSKRVTQRNGARLLPQPSPRWQDGKQHEPGDKRRDERDEAADINQYTGGASSGIFNNPRGNR
jgi:hypothetical protein